MIFKSEKRQFDTDNITVTNLIDGSTHIFHADHIRYHINYTCEHCPERLQTLVDNGEILTYLEEFDVKVTDAICDQTDLLMENSKEYQIALETGNLIEVGSIGNMLRENAKEIVYEDMVYVWLATIIYSKKLPW